MRSRLHGRIEDGTPTIELRARRSGKTLVADAVVDTGFPGAITVPVGSFARWGIATPDWFGSVRLADGTELECPFALLTVDWFDEARTVAACELGDGVLVGMELLDGTTLGLRSPHLLIAR